MTPKYYKYCMVPMCKNTTVKTPDKLFIRVPSNKAIRRQWLELANSSKRDSASEAAVMSTNGNFCEDHFDLPKDMENYMKYRIMGAVCKISMRPGCLPSKFECQHRTTSRASDPPAVNKETSTECNELEKIETVPEPWELRPNDTSTTYALKGRKWYRSCMVPQCRNTTVTAPGTMFIRVPDKPKMRQKWLELARRKATMISPTSALYCCGDHFDLPNDMQNYMRYKLMGSVKAVRMVPGCLPSRFDCQPDRRKRLSYKTTRPLALKRQRAELIKDAESSVQIASVPKLEKETNVDRTMSLNTSDSSPAVEMERDYSASATDWCPVRVKTEREECASETDTCPTETLEFVRVKEESCFEPEIKIEVEIGPESLQPQDVYYTLNTTMKTESICKLEPFDYEDSGITKCTEI